MLRSLPVKRLQFEALGTAWQIDAAPMADDEWAQLNLAIRTRLERFEQTYSRFRPDSLVTTISRQAGRYLMPDDADGLLGLYRELYDATAGKLTPLIGAVLEQAGYDAAYSLKAGQLKQPPSWEAVLDWRPPYLTVTEPSLLDFGAAGKGYAADLVAAMLRDANVAYFCVDASGDLRSDYPADESLAIGLEHPAQANTVIGTVELSQGGLCGSATNRRRWSGYHHLIDPVALSSPEHLSAVWVKAATAALADGLSTALFFNDAEVLQQHFDFEYLLVDNQYRVKQSSGFGAKLFLS